MQVPRPTKTQTNKTKDLKSIILHRRTQERFRMRGKEKAHLWRNQVQQSLLKVESFHLPAAYAGRFKPRARKEDEQQRRKAVECIKRGLYI